MGHYPAFICENGHEISTFSRSCSDKYCKTCGAKVISSCPSCGATIKGRSDGDYGFLGSFGVPAYCPSCGKPYPWTSNAIQATIYMLEEEDRISYEDRQKMIEVLPDIISETPKTQLASIRYKRLVAIGGFVAEGLRDFAVNYACDLFRNFVDLP